MMRNKERLIMSYKAIIFCALLFCCFVFAPTEFFYTTPISVIYAKAPLQVLPWFFLLLIFHIREINYDPIKLIVLVLYGWMLTVTLLGGSDISDFTSASILPLLGFFLAYYATISDKKELLDSWYWLLVAFLIINIASVFLFPNGLVNLAETTSKVNGVNEKCFFWGKNTAIKSLLLGILVSYVRDFYYWKKVTWRTYLFAAGIFANSILVQSSTSMISSAILIIGVVMCNYGKQFKVGITGGIIVNIVFFVFVVLFRLQNYFQFFIEGVLGKDLGFSSRTTIWDIALYYISFKPITGYGIQNNSTVAQMTGLTNNSFHNFVIDWLFLGGIISIIIWIILLSVFSSRINKTLEAGFASGINVIFFAFFIVWTTETFGRSRITTFMCMMGIIAAIIAEKNNEKKHMFSVHIGK